MIFFLVCASRMKSKDSKVIKNTYIFELFFILLLDIDNYCLDMVWTKFQNTEEIRQIMTPMNAKTSKIVSIFIIY